MSYRSLTTALTLYRGETLSLEDAAAYGGVSVGRLATAARSRGITVRREDAETLDAPVAK